MSAIALKYDTAPTKPLPVGMSQEFLKKTREGGLPFLSDEDMGELMHKIGPDVFENIPNHEIGARVMQAVYARLSMTTRRWEETLRSYVRGIDSANVMTRLELGARFMIAATEVPPFIRDVSATCAYRDRLGLALVRLGDGMLPSGPDLEKVGAALAVVLRDDGRLKYLTTFGPDYVVDAMWALYYLATKAGKDGEATPTLGDSRQDVVMKVFNLIVGNPDFDAAVVMLRKFITHGDENTEDEDVEEDGKAKKQGRSKVDCINLIEDEKLEVEVKLEKGAEDQKQQKDTKPKESDKGTGSDQDKKRKKDKKQQKDTKPEKSDADEDKKRKKDKKNKKDKKDKKDKKQKKDKDEKGSKDKKGSKESKKQRRLDKDAMKAVPEEAAKQPAAVPAAVPEEAAKQPAAVPAAGSEEAAKQPAAVPDAVPEEAAKQPAAVPAAVPEEVAKQPAAVPAAVPEVDAKEQAAVKAAVPAAVPATVRKEVAKKPALVPAKPALVPAAVVKPIVEVAKETTGVGGAGEKPPKQAVAKEAVAKEGVAKEAVEKEAGAKEAAAAVLPEEQVALAGHGIDAAVAKEGLRLDVKKDDDVRATAAIGGAMEIDRVEDSDAESPRLPSYKMQKLAEADEGNKSLGDSKAELIGGAYAPADPFGGASGASAPAEMMAGGSGRVDKRTREYRESKVAESPSKAQKLPVEEKVVDAEKKGAGRKRGKGK